MVGVGVGGRMKEHCEFQRKYPIGDYENHHLVPWLVGFSKMSKRMVLRACIDKCKLQYDIKF
jgi:hypothetical protein